MGLLLTLGLVGAQRQLDFARRNGGYNGYKKFNFAKKTIKGSKNMSRIGSYARKFYNLGGKQGWIRAMRRKYAYHNRRRYTIRRRLSTWT